MGVQAQKQLAADQVAALAAQALVGQLAEGSLLPSGLSPQGLAQRLQQETAFAVASRGGNVLRRIQNGELMQQVANAQPEAQAVRQAPKIEGPAL